VIGTGDDSLVLRERAGGVLELLFRNVVLLSNASLGTERAFGGLVGTVLGRPARRVLVGGLGFGATVAGALEALDGAGEVVVVEKVAAVESLVRGELAWVCGDPLSDARVSVRVADVMDVMAGAPQSFDAVLLDVDNGPNWASFRCNARLYTPTGLEAVARSLTPGGALAVWSGYPADAFQVCLRKAGLEPSIVLLRERGLVRARAYVGLKREGRCISADPFGAIPASSVLAYGK
jgi:predicted membrane-bound spermidine synthase